MKTLICPYCACSLVRLGVSRDQAVTHTYDGREYHFCCQGCVDLFVTDAEQHLQRTRDLIVCPTCLGEKPPESAFMFEHAGQEIHYCGCPYCREVFEKDPSYYSQRLEGAIPSEGVLGHDGGSVRPS